MSFISSHRRPDRPLLALHSPLWSRILFLLAVTASGALGQIKINEVQTGASDAIELWNPGDVSVSLGGWKIRVFVGTGTAAPIPDAVFTLPAGTVIARQGLLVCREGNPPSGGAPAGTVFTGFNWNMTGTATVEVVLEDDGGKSHDYVIRRRSTGSLTPNKPADATWSGLLEDSGGIIERAHLHDRNRSRDWRVRGGSDTLGSRNPVQFGNGHPHSRVMVTEVAWGDVDALEITNFTDDLVDMTGWRVKWDNGTLRVSDPLNVALIPGESIIVREPGSFSAPPGVRDLVRFGSLGTGAQAFVVGLFEPGDQVVDQVSVTSATGQNPSGFFGVEREGIARRGITTGPSGLGSVERIFGYDSDSSDDWTEQPVHSLGLENLSSGLRTPGTPTGDKVLITEINVSNGMLELFNDSSFPVDLQNFFFLTSRRQGAPLTLATPFSSQTVVAPGGFAVIGSGTTRPPFVSPSAVFVGLSETGQFLDIASLETVVALYTDRGTLLDLVRATGTGSEVLHSDPRPPAPPRSFLGGVSRPLVPNISRIGTVTDTNSGEDWINVPDITLGTSNGTFGLRGFGAAIDVRFHDSGTGRGLALLINGTPSLAGMSYQILFSATHSDGRGPILGMGLDVLSNFQVTQGVFPFAGTLDGRGAARADLPPGSLPQGIELDCVFLLLDGSDFVDRTRVLRFDT